MAYPANRRGKIQLGSNPLLGSVVRIVAWIGIPIAILLGLFWWRIDATVQSGIDAASPFAQINRGRTFFWLNGDVGVTQFQMVPRTSKSGDGTLSAERVTVHTPGLWWIVKTALFGLDRPPERLGITMQNLQLSGIVHGAGSDWIGLYSASPFEAEGCSANDWTRSDIAEMGLPQHPALLTWMIEFPLPDELRMSWDWQTDGVGSARASMNLKFAGDIIKSKTMIDTGTLNSAKLTFTDGGFVAARNAYCEQRLHLNEAQFIDRHMTAVGRVLMSHSVQASAELTQMYRDFATHGGALDIQFRPQTALNLASLSTLTAANWQDMLSPLATLNGGAPILLRFDPVARVPLGVAGDAVLAARADRAPVSTDAPADATRVVAAAPTPATSTTSAPVAVKQAEATPAAGANKPLSYAELESMVGQRVVVATKLDTVRVGILSKVNTSALTLTFDNGAVMTFTAGNVRSVTAAPATPAPAATSANGSGNHRAKKN